MSKPRLIDFTKPNTFIAGLTKYITRGDLLDIGAGRGRHSLFFASKGFNVTAVEPDPQQCQEMSTLARAMGLPIKVVENTVADFSTNKQFDAVVCSMVLHFLPFKEINQAIGVMLNLTKAGGFHAVSAYTNLNKPDFLRAGSYGEEKYLFKPGELRQFYDGWKILEYLEDWTKPAIVKVGDVPQSWHKVSLFARK